MGQLETDFGELMTFQNLGNPQISKEASPLEKLGTEGKKSLSK